MPVNSRGVFTEEGAPFNGQFVFKANDQIIANLQDRGLLFAYRKYPAFLSPLLALQEPYYFPRHGAMVFEH